MSRSLKVNRQSIQTVKAALKRCGFRSQRSLAEDLNMALSTISRFLNGKPVDFAIFVEICDRLTLDWQTITDIAGNDTSKPALDASSSQTPQTAFIAPIENSSDHIPSAEGAPDAPWQDWGEAIDTSFFHGRRDELSQLQTAILTDKCRLVAILGIGGIGKTSLAAKLARAIAPDVDAVIWRSVRNAPPLKTLLQDLVPFLSQQHDLEPTLERLFHWLRRHRCLVILDNIETLLERGQTGQYRAGYEDYGTLLQQFGETIHRSCLILTSREKPSEIGLLESDQLLTRSFQLGGSAEAAQFIVETKGLLGEPETIKQFCQRYGDNPLAVKIVGTSIQAIFGGDITLFLQENAPIFNDFRRLLNQQFERLSPLEQSILYWLAINREWTSISELLDDIWPTVSRADVFEALESLSWRSLIETKVGQYTQQPVIMEYVTDRLIQTICTELDLLNQQEDPVISSSLLFCTHALLKTTTKDYIRDSQRRMILGPLVQQLQTTLVQPHLINQYVMSILATLRQSITGYGIGNFINLCRQLQINLAGYDFSNLAIWQAELQEINLQSTNFSQANFQNCQFNQQFGGIPSLALNSDDTLLAAGDTGGAIHIWQVETYQHLGTISGHTDGVFSLAFSPDDHYLLSGGGDNTLKLWRLRDYSCIKTFEGHGQAVTSGLFFADGNRIASASFDHSIKLWDVASGQCLHTLEGHTDRVSSLTVATAETILVSASLDDTIKLWDWQQGECIVSLNGHQHSIWSIEFAPENSFLVSGGIDKTVRIWDTRTGQCLNILSGHPQAIWSVKVSPDGRYIASADCLGLIKLWSFKSGRCEQSFYGHSSALWPSSLVFSKNSQRLYSGSQDRTIRVWDLQSGYTLKTLAGYRNSVWTLTFSSDGKTLVSGSHDSTIRLWDIDHRQLSLTIPHDGPVFCLNFSPDGQYLASGGGKEKAILKIWNLENATLAHTLTGHTRTVRAVQFHPHSSLLFVSASDDKTCKFWDIASNNSSRTFAEHKDPIFSAIFSHDAKYLATGSFDHSIKLWHGATGELLNTLVEHTDHVFSVVFSPDDSLLASTSADTTIKFWSVQTGHCLKTLTGHTNVVLIGRFSPDGSTFVSGGFNGNIKIWDVNTGECCHTVQAHAHMLWALAFSPDGTLLASGGEGDTIKLWDTQSWQCIDAFQLPGPYEGMNLTGVTGLSTAQKTSLQALGAISGI